MKDQLKKLLPHLGIILGFIAISSIYFYPAYQGKTLRQGDVVNITGTHKSLNDYNENHPDNPALWTDASFSGMPTNLIKQGDHYNVLVEIRQFFDFELPGKTVGVLFTYLLCFYVLGLSLNWNKWLSAIGAIAFAFASYKIIIIGAGHINKALVMAYLPIATAGLINIFRKKYLLGFILAMLGLGFNISAGHPQITYYLGMAFLLYLMIQAYILIKEKNYKHLIQSSLILLVATILAIAPATKKLWSTYSYSHHSIRGDRIIDKGKDNKDGLDKDYALEWSYGKMETFTLLIPNFMGGASHGVLDKSSKTYQALQNRGVKNPEHIASSLSAYWGDQRFTEGPVYIGAIIFFLFILGLFTVRGPVKWWAVSVSILAILLSWGDNFIGFTDFFFYNVPFYNKFRTVSMILILVGLIWPIFSIMGLRQFILQHNRKEALKNLKYSFYIVGGILLFFIIFSGALFDFHASVDQRYIKMGYPEWIIDVLREDRQALLRADAFRSLIFISLAAGTLYLYNQNKLKYKYLLTLIGVLVLIDLWAIDKRHVNNKDFKEKTIKKSDYQVTPADEYILQDTNYYRVLSLRGPFVSARESYFHNSIGGYHGAKLRRYQDLIENHLQQEINMLTNTLSGKQKGRQAINNALAKANCLNMLNTKYIIYDVKSRPLKNPYAAGPCWFVDSFDIVTDANEEMSRLRNFNSRKVAFYHQEFQEHLTNLSLTKTSSSTINIIDTDLNHKKYKSSSENKQLAVFSEIYYPKGWKAYIDGKQVPILRANYLLRSIIIPKGEHEIDFIFEPKSFYMGKKFSIAGSALVIITLAIALFFLIKKKYKP